MSTNQILPLDGEYMRFWELCDRWEHLYGKRPPNQYLCDLITMGELKIKPLPKQPFSFMETAIQLGALSDSDQHHVFFDVESIRIFELNNPSSTIHITQPLTELDPLLGQNSALNEELLIAHKKIKELEEQLETFKNKPFSGECCNTKNVYYPPELHTAIQLWEALYLHGGANLERDSHSADVEKWIRNNANEWINNQFTKNSRALERIKAVTTPIKKKVTPSK